ncbi:polyprotein [cosavirus F1]|uniref:Genome polyprotein n=1 Tax=cosavirus F1 TaxID=2849713 RepID=I1YLT6_9PICO|nr:polyprotein [Cosavirus F]AFJ04539.1 polyprotein [Cosavirus F]
MGANNSKTSANTNGNEGTTVNNFYANNYYGSIDASAQGIGSCTTPENGNVSGILGLAGSAFNALSLLANPRTENSTYLEDRVLTRTAGNTSINSQAAEGVLNAYAKESDQTCPTSCGDKPSEGTPATDRGFVVQLKPWAKTNAAYDAQWYRITDQLKIDERGNIFTKNMKSHAYLKAGYEVTLQVNTSPFHCGLVGLFMVPEWTRYGPTGEISWTNLLTRLTLVKNNDLYEPQTYTSPSTLIEDYSFDLADFTPEQMMLFPHQFINPKDTNIATVRVPYVNAAPTNDPTVHTIWTAVVMVICPLNFSNGASPIVNMTLTITPVNSVFNGLRQYAQGPIPVRTFHNSSQFATTVPLRAEPCYGMTVTPPTDYMPDPIDDLVSVAKVPSFVCITDSIPYFAVSNATQGSKLIRMNVVLSDPHFQHTLLASLAEHFCNYRGSLQVTLLSCCTAMTRGKLLVAYTPPGAGAPESIDQAMQGTYTIWDLGLQSSLNFTIPFISAVDFRLNSSARSSVLNSDGWFSVWLMSPLTYPPNTPPTQQIVMMLSAGDDFSYRLPIHPPLAQNGDGPHDNPECGKTENTDASLNSGHSVGLPTSHSHTKFFFDRYRFLGILKSYGGVSPVPVDPIDSSSHKVRSYARILEEDPRTKTPYSMIALTPLPSLCGVPLSGYLYAKNTQTETTPGPRILRITTGDPELYRSCPFTYFKSDLEITVVPSSAITQDYRIVWYPPGAPIDTLLMASAITGGNNSFSTSDVINTSASVETTNPQFVGTPGSKVSFVIPYCSPLSLIPLYFDGYPDYSRTPGLYGTSPGSSFGVLTVDCPTAGAFSVYIRYKNFRGYIPRPLIRRKHKAVESRSRKILAAEPLPRDYVPLDTLAYRNVRLGLLKQAGDVEENPGPAVNTKFAAQGPVMELINMARDPTTVENVTRLVTTLNNLMEKWNNLKETMTDAVFLRDMLCLLIKFGSLLYLCQDKGPTAYFAAATVFLCDGITFFDWYDKIKTFLSTRLRTAPPFFASAQGPDLRQVVTFFNAAKGVQWMIDSIRSLIGWIKEWLELEEKNKATELEEMLIASPEHCKNINLYNRGEIFARPTESFEFIDRLCTLATTLGKTHIATYFTRFTSVTSDTVRPEPVVVVLRGRPGAGKSGVATILAAAISKTLTGSQSVYTLSPDTEHMDGYHGQFVTLIDDLGQNPDGEDFRSFCQMVSTAQYRPPMANLEDKGILFTSRVIIATTNLNDFAPTTIADPKALQRRINFDIVAAPGPACTRNGKLDLNAALKPDGPGEFPYTTDCPLLHTTGMSLHNTKSKVTMNVKDLVDAVVKKIKHRKTVCAALENLVAQGGPEKIVGYTKDDEGIAIVDCLAEWDKIKDQKKKQKALEMVAQELRDKHRIHTDMVTLLKHFLTGLGVVSAVLAAYMTLKLFKDDKSESQENKEEVTKTKDKEAKAEGPYNGPAKKDLKVLKLKAQGPMLDAEKKIMDNVYPFKLKCGNKWYVQSCLALARRVILVNTHAVDTLEEEFYVGDSCYNYRDCEIATLDCGEGATDITAIKLPAGREFKSIVRNFCPKDTTIYPGTRLTILSNDTMSMVREGSFLRFEDNVPTNIGYMPFTMLYRSSSYFGMCGSAVMVRGSNNVGVVGIHCAGGGGVSVATRMTLRMAETLMDHFYPKMAQGKIVEVVKASDYVHVPRRSKLKRTNATYDATGLYGPAVLSKHDPRLDPGVDLDTVIFSKHKQNKEIEQDSEVWRKMAMSAEIYAGKFKDKDFSPLTQKEAILGIPGLDRLDPNTASGLPYTKTRRQMIDFNTGEVLDKELQERIDTWLKGEKPKDMRYQTFLKDEIRPIEKVKAGKTRIIDVPPLDHVIVFRMLFGKFMAHYHLNPGFEIGSAIGCDPDIAWASFGFSLNQCDYKYDFDYSNFDSCHSVSVFKILEEYFFNEENGFDPRCSLLLRSLAVSTHAYEDKQIHVEGGLPSGTAGTSVLNTVINNIIMHASLYYTYSNFEWDDIKMLAYGDDIVASSDHLLDLERVKYFMSLIGYTITPADKSEKFTPKDMNSISFLKRKFVKVAGVWAPVMETSNLEAMLSWYKPGTLQEKLDSVSQLAHHSGQDVYNHLMTPFMEDGFKIKPWKERHLEWLNKLT